MTLPADSHVHSEWSWDAPGGSMAESCRRAVDLGLPAIAFTEHVDHTVWRVATELLAPEDHLTRMSEDGLLRPPAFDVEGYLAAVEECRDRFPELRVLSGLELGEPHRHAPQVGDVLRRGDFDRVLGSVHSLPSGSEYAEPPGLFPRLGAAEVLRRYLAEVVDLASSDGHFEVLAHIDYPLRSWPSHAAPFDPHDFEHDFRETLRAVASSGRALEVSTRVPLHRLLLRWWREEGGQAVSFGSDAHDPASVARGFRAVVHLAESEGFRPGPHPHELWGR
ncbi:PHP domain-containing protein [Nocardioides coralli]|uniref:PHP domain-containing protein n=1 Tax=Nocardioides coralli TaxID=2872154 RepID=UPI001CA3911E|nr:PHP domain-containing protein [Nocardioides coralli]QZY29104.1 PHP domain-containing protein [Nocardioides coralli]